MLSLLMDLLFWGLPNSFYSVFVAPGGPAPGSIPPTGGFSQSIAPPVCFAHVFPGEIFSGKAARGWQQLLSEGP